jgi:hypothetical protein
MTPISPKVDNYRYSCCQNFKFLLKDRRHFNPACYLVLTSINKLLPEFINSFVLLKTDQCFKNL